MGGKRIELHFLRQFQGGRLIRVEGLVFGDWFLGARDRQEIPALGGGPYGFKGRSQALRWVAVVDRARPIGRRPGDRLGFAPRKDPPRY